MTRTGEWSPTCEACWWDDGAGPTVGSWFTGRNRRGGRVWETRSQVVTAEPGRAFGWVVGDHLVNWSYQIEPEGGSCLLTEAWESLPAGLAVFRARYGDAADTEIAERSAAAVSGIPVTLEALRRVAEAS